MAFKCTSSLRVLFTGAVLGMLMVSSAQIVRAQFDMEVTQIVQDSSGTILSIGYYPNIGSYPNGTGNGFFGSFDNVVFSSNTGTFDQSLAAGPNSIFNPTSDSVLKNSVDQLTNNDGSARIATLLLTANGYAGPANLNSAALSFSGLWLDAAGSSITAKWYEDPNNGLSKVMSGVGETALKISYAGPQVGSTVGPGSFFAPDNNPRPFAFSATGLPVSSSTPYGLTLQYTLALTPGASLYNFNQSERISVRPAAVPEPGNVALFAGLSVAGAVVRARWKRARITG